MENNRFETFVDYLYKRTIHGVAVDDKNNKKIKMNRGVSKEGFNETSYYIENGLRKVYPYYFVSTTYTKGQWVGKTLLEVFGNEVRDHSSDEYERSIEKGFLTVNHERVKSDYVLKHNDMIMNLVHRHEVPVVSDKIDIIFQDENIVVINKPASIPVYPCGQYKHNSVMYILAKEYNLDNLKTSYCLDRMVSGILILGKTPNVAQALEAQMRKGKVEKFYLCLIDGEFQGPDVCEEPIEVISYEIGVWKVSSIGKPCATRFDLLKYNEKTNTSILLCSPSTGGMHQVRVHLQYMGYPIKNDPIYNNTVFGPEKGRGGNFGKTDEQLLQDLMHAHKAENWLNTEEDPFYQHPITDMSSVESTEKLQPEKKIIDPSSDPDHKIMSTLKGTDVPDVEFVKKLSEDFDCQECKVQYKDPKPEDLMMYLHAFTYSGPDWMYKTPKPSWANMRSTE